MIGLLLGAVMGLGADVITVDDDGPADFATIEGALGAAVDGDVILVHEGFYDAFEVHDSVSILGPSVGARPSIDGQVIVKSGSVTLAGLDFTRLRLIQVSDRAVVDDCRVGLWNNDQGAAASVDQCDEVLFSRCEIAAAQSASATVAGPGLGISGSRVALVQCTIRGGDGRDVFDRFGTGGNGGAGVVASGSDLTIDACRIEGGEGGYGQLFGGPAYGTAGDGLVLSASTALARGSSEHWILSGSTQPPKGFPGYDIALSFSSVLVISGLSYDPTNVYLQVGTTLETPQPAEPWVEIDGDNAPASVRQVLVHGPAGELAFLLLGLEQDLITLPFLEVPLWLRPDKALLLPVVTTGPDVPVTVPLQLPTSFEGLEGTTLYAQAVFKGIGSTLLPGKKTTTNPAVIVVRF